MSNALISILFVALRDRGVEKYGRKTYFKLLQNPVGNSEEFHIQIRHIQLNKILQDQMYSISHILYN
jgi:hypothetical protein